MPQPARVLQPGDVRRVLSRVRHHRHATRDRAMVLLSFKAGLRACEIAGLSWTMVLKPTGRLAPLLHVSRTIAKNRRARDIPLHPDLAKALEKLRVEYGNPRDGPVLRSERGSALTAASVVNWFGAVYSTLGLDGCSSHSGRRTFITTAARQIARTGGSLRDIQELAGHRSLTTTERYIEGNRDAQRKLIRLL